MMLRIANGSTMRTFRNDFDGFFQWCNRKRRMVANVQMGLLVEWSGADIAFGF